ncbi:hypothetical protein AB0465_11400 [Streptomyces griseoviridis]|uniref:hypothetical protein n=1 Tax=Streptomyces griseoviridis TaxID=45398 RepID=UPI00344EF1F6
MSHPTSPPEVRSAAPVEQIADTINYVLLPVIANREVRQETARRAATEVLELILPGLRITAGLARDASVDVERVTALYERWVKAGPPPLGASMARWWDQRLAELHAAVLGTTDAPGRPS